MLSRKRDIVGEWPFLVIKLKLPWFNIPYHTILFGQGLSFAQLENMGVSHIPWDGDSMTEETIPTQFPGQSICTLAKRNKSLLCRIDKLNDTLVHLQHPTKQLDMQTRWPVRRQPKEISKEGRISSTIQLQMQTMSPVASVAMIYCWPVIATYKLRAKLGPCHKTLHANACVKVLTICNRRGAENKC